MTMHPGSESEWEDLALEKLADLGWRPEPGEDIAPGKEERDAWNDLPLPGRLLDALRTLNPGIPNEQLLQARAEILAPAVERRDHREPAGPRVDDPRLPDHVHRRARHRAQPDPAGDQRRTVGERLARGQPGHDQTTGGHATLRRRPLLQRSAGRRPRAEEGRVRARRPGCRPRPARHVPPRVPDRVPVLRAHRDQRRHHRALRHPVHPAQPLLAVERRRRRPGPARERARPGRATAHRARGHPRRDLPPAPLSAADARLRRLRRGRRRDRQARRQAAPVLRREQGGRQHDRGGPDRRQGRCGLAHPGVGQVDGDGALHQPGAAPPPADQPHGRRDHRPQGARRAAVQRVPDLPAAPRDPGADPHPQPAADGAVQPGRRRHPVHDAAEVRADDRRTLQRLGPPAALRPPQHHRGRRRGAPQPLRRPRRLRPPPARRPAARHADRLHRDADLASGNATPRRCSATTSTSTTCPARSPTAPRCRSTSSRAWSRSGSRPASARPTWTPLPTR